MSEAADQTLVTVRAKPSAIHQVLTKAGFQPARGADWVNGKAVHPCSGYVLVPGEHPGRLKLSYEHLEGTEATEAEFLNRMRDALTSELDLAVESIDAERARNVALEITGTRALTPADLVLLAAISEGRIVWAGRRWHDVEAAAGDPSPLNLTVVPELFLTGWAEHLHGKVAAITDAGQALLTELTVPSVVLEA
ncbi:hypothetical protein GCM10010442_43300 [Kitasatospora kifunensis]